MLIVADELTGGIGGKSGLARTGKAEENRGNAIVADVGGAVHGQNALLGKDEVHDGERRLLDFAGVLGAADNGKVLFVIEHDGGFGARIVALRVALEARSGDDGVVSLEVFKRLGGKAAKKLMDEEVLGCQLVDDAEVLGVLGIGARAAVEHVHFLAGKVVAHALVQSIEGGLAGRLVDGAPLDQVVNAFAVDDELVLCGTTGVLARLNNESTCCA